MNMKKKVSAAADLIIPKGTSTREIYTRAKEAFSAADLQKFTEDEPTISAEKVLEELKQIHRKTKRKRKA